MSAESSGTKLPLIKIALYGPARSGKTAFKNTFLGKRSLGDYIPTEKVEVVEVVRTFFRIRSGRKIPVETYRLAIADLPSKEELLSERLANLSRCVGLLLFYDVTDPVSPQILMKMVEDEIISGGYLQNMIALSIIGTKKDLGINKDAIMIGQELADKLSKEIKSIWNYDVPHLIVSALNVEEVKIVIEVMEHILMTLSIPKDLVNKLSATAVLEGAVFPSVELVKEEEILIKPELKRPEALAEEAMEIAKREKVIEEKYKLIPATKPWDLLKNLASKYPEIEKILLLVTTSRGEIYTAFYPGEPTLENIPIDLVDMIVAFGKSLKDVLIKEEMGDLSYAILHGTKKSVLYTRLKGGKGIIVIKTKGKPSEELIRFFTE
ncbi:MAG: hypothetical protein ACTSUJ_04705 [Candidatus Njordarchaeales archaeon]